MKRAVALLGEKEVQSIMEREGKIEVSGPRSRLTRAAAGERHGHPTSSGQRCWGLWCQRRLI